MAKLQTVSQTGTGHSNPIQLNHNGIAPISVIGTVSTGSATWSVQVTLDPLFDKNGNLNSSGIWVDIPVSALVTQSGTAVAEVTSVWEGFRINQTGTGTTVLKVIQAGVATN